MVGGDVMKTVATWGNEDCSSTAAGSCWDGGDLFAKGNQERLPEKLMHDGK